MAHFAKIENNIVVTVTVIDNAVLLNSEGVETEQLGIDFCNELLVGTWVQTSYNNNFRKNYAGTGMLYDANRDAFYTTQPYPSWLLNEDNCQWQPPVAMPVDDNIYNWNETEQSWEVIEGEE